MSEGREKWVSPGARGTDAGGAGRFALKEI